MVNKMKHEEFEELITWVWRACLGSAVFLIWLKVWA